MNRAGTSTTDGVITPIGRQYLRLHLAGDVGPIRFARLLEHFGAVEAVLSASVAELERVHRVGRKTAQSIYEAARNDGAEEQIEQAAQAGVRIICLADPDYPLALKRITDPPTCLYVRGRIEPADAVAVGIVGARRCSHYGMEQTRRFAEGLARAGFTIVSGLARGIDSIAHRGALTVEGRTLAVLGNGLGAIYPPEHESLADQVCDAGAIISELPMETGPDAKHFPPRNRIIAGLSLGILVIEAGQRSGALISARLAGEYNREVFALPGRVDQPATSAGVNGLIRDGAARLVTCIQDVFDDLAEVGRIMGAEIDPTGDNGAASGDARADKPTAESEAPLFDALRSDPPRRRDPAAVSSTGVDATATTGAPTLGAGTNDSIGGGVDDRARAVLEAIRAGAKDFDTILTDTDLGADQVVGVLTLLELKGLIRKRPGNRYEPRSAT